MARSAKRFASFEKNVQKSVQKVVQKRVPENGQGLAKTLFSTTFLGISKIVRTNVPPSPARGFENVTHASRQA